jgi:hypothetical protein
LTAKKLPNLLVIFSIVKAFMAIPFPDRPPPRCYPSDGVVRSAWSTADLKSKENNNQIPKLKQPNSRMTIFLDSTVRLTSFLLSRIDLKMFLLLFAKISG